MDLLTDRSEFKSKSCPMFQGCDSWIANSDRPPPVVDLARTVFDFGVPGFVPSLQCTVIVYVRTFVDFSALSDR